MKKIILFSLVLSFFTCAQTTLSPSETAQIVVESFYQNDKTKLKQYTTDESYNAFMSVQAIVAQGNDYKASNFKVLNKTSDDTVAWVKFTTSYENKPETFKLVKVDGHWLVTEKGLREKGPF